MLVEMPIGAAQAEIRRLRIERFELLQKVGDLEAQLAKQSLITETQLEEKGPEVRVLRELRQYASLTAI